MWLDVAGLDWVALQLYARSEDGTDSRSVVLRPYRGLSPFGPAQRRFLFGREAERAQARQMLSSLAAADRPRFLLVTGASGTGKSSVVLGGLLPDLLSTHGAASVQASPQSRQALVEMLQKVRTDWPALTTAIDGLLQELHKLSQLSSGGEWDALILRPGPTPLDSLLTLLAGRKHPERKLLLVVDQLEELFTHCDDPQTRSAFVQKLWSLSQSGTDTFCVVTLRVDFLGRCGELVLDDEGLRLDRIAYSDAHRLFVAQPGKEQLAAAIAGPAQLVGLEISSSLIDRIVAEVVGEPDESRRVLAVPSPWRQAAPSAPGSGVPAAPPKTSLAREAPHPVPAPLLPLASARALSLGPALAPVLALAVVFSRAFSSFSPSAVSVASAALVESPRL